jgi:excisionase family DNA binding protein
VCDVSDQPIDLEGVRKGDALLDEAERLREESGREKRQLSPEDLEGIYMGEQQQTYTVSDAAELTGYHPESIRRHIRDDKLKAAQTGKGNYRISRPELARWWREELGGGELFDDDGTDSNE